MTAVVDTTDISAPARTAGAVSFATTGLPTQKLEDWRFTPLGDLATATFTVAPAATVEAAARQCEVSERTVYRRLEDPVFRSRVQEARGEMVRRAAGLLTAAAGQAEMGGARPAVGMFAVSCGRELLHGAGTAASLTGWAIQTHLAETRRECDLVRELHGGLGYVEVYRAAGLLTPRTLLGHGIWLDAADHAVIAASGAGIAHCPTANLFLDAGAMDRAAAAEAGVAVSLGSDVAGGPDRSMVRVARAMIDTAVSLGRATPTAARAWWQITTGNAAALGDDDAGRLAPGAPADLLCILPDSGWEGTPDPLSMLLHAWDDRWIRTTLVLGRPAFTA